MMCGVKKMSKLVFRFETEVCLKAQPKMGILPRQGTEVLASLFSLLMRPPITIV